MAGRNKNGRSLDRSKRSAAFLAAALIASAQLLAAIHCHRNFLTADVNAQAAIGIDDGPCAVCLLAFHSPLNPASAPAIARPQVAIPAAFAPAPYSCSLPDLSSSSPRAPPRPA
jgi:hypothetical protein